MKNNRQRRIALLLNTPQRALITLAISATDLGDYLKKHLNECSWIFRPDTIPIKNNRANTSARRLRTSPFYQ